MIPNSLLVVCGGAALAAFVAGPGVAHAATVSISQEALFDLTGKDFQFVFDPLAASDGTGGTVVIEAGGPSSKPGVDVDDSDEFFDVALDGEDFGRFSCASATGVTQVDSFEIIAPFDCAFTQTIELDGAKLNALLADRSITAFLNFNNKVGAFADQQDFVRVTLNYSASTAIPLPPSGLLLLAALGGLGLSCRKRSRST